MFDGLEVAPRSATVDDLGLERAVDRLREGVVVAIADAAEGMFKVGLAQPLGAFDRP